MCRIKLVGTQHFKIIVRWQMWFRWLQGFGLLAELTRLGSVVGVCVAATRLHAESAAVCDFCVALAALTAQSHRVGEGRVSPRSTAWQLDGLIRPVPEVTGVLEVWRH